MSRIVDGSSAESSKKQQEQQQQQQQQQTPARSKLVQKLLDASASLPQFMNDLLTTQAVIVAGTEAAAFLVERKEEGISLRPVAHIRPDDSDQETRQAALRAFHNIVQPCAVQAKDGAIEVGSPDGGDAQFCLVTLLRNEGDVVAISAVIARARDMDRAKQRLVSMQLVAGYFELYSLRRYTEQAKAMAERHQNVLQYAGAVSMAEGFASAAMGLCNELAGRTGATRVSIGWMKGRHVRVKALSHTEKFDKKQELIVRLEKVMEECLDQDEPVRFLPNGTSTANVTRAARELSESQSGNSVISVPLRRREEVVGILTLEFPPDRQVDEPLEMAIGVASELLAPQLWDRWEADRYIWVKMGHSIRNSWRFCFGKHAGATVLTLLIVGLLTAILAWPINYRLRAPFQLVAENPRSIMPPFDGYLERVMVKAGQRVSKGDVLAQMNVTELQDQYVEAMKEAEAKEKEGLGYRAEKKNIEAQVAFALANASRAKAKWVKARIDDAQVKAPFDAVVLKGDLWGRQGARVSQGDVLFELAEVSKENPEWPAIEVLAMVSERDIQEMLKYCRPDDPNRRELDGEIATSSYPSQGYPFRIKRWVPMGKAEEGENVFQVYGDVIKPEQWMHPGLAGQARIDTDKRPIAWIITHRLIDWLKLKLWI